MSWPVAVGAVAGVVFVVFWLLVLWGASASGKAEDEARARWIDDQRQYEEDDLDDS